VAEPSYLTADQRKDGAGELQRIAKTPIWGATYLLKETLAWANAHSNDPRVPRALHMAVGASRFRERDDDSGKYSKAAFDLLHRRYAKSEWAEKTKYWY
jgi:hypothetical protein